MNVLIINGHPDTESYNKALADAYYEGVLTNVDVNTTLIEVGALEFNLNLKYGYRRRMELEPDLEFAIKEIKKANHIVWVLPLWWGGMPAVLKGFLDRILLPGIAFELEEGKTFQKKLFKNKTSSIILTADTPKWYYRLFLKSALLYQFKKGILEFCGIKLKKTTYIAPIRNSTLTFRENWLKKIKMLGKQLT
ncbi:NAD(P)H-dependent oxidoreductase [Tenacibaculum sp. M341]|uniref:NAD(P)H-dependent oxidoreductase n=1 Tax=Tenacibaculum sp. M341 TaxID=2530339 RepID=UPI001051BB38|nr:NAD(P)H-dependent oxidoreductase [Tenacibaculum sp. M341]TCI91374.1 flavodoxin family protein [Tenacibaculum sp. M341]